MGNGKNKLICFLCTNEVLSTNPVENTWKFKKKNLAKALFGLYAITLADFDFSLHLTISISIANNNQLSRLIFKGNLIYMRYTKFGLLYLMFNPTKLAENLSIWTTFKLSSWIPSKIRVITTDRQIKRRACLRILRWTSINTLLIGS